jgi:uncharacterized metal-binding protein YceD (DUF177 family)
MNAVAKSAVVKNRALHFAQDTTFKGYAFSYPLLAVKKCHYEGALERLGDYVHATYTINATVNVADSRDNVPFNKKLALSEDIDILDEEDTAGEGFVVNGSEIDLEELALRLIVSSLPIRLVRDEETALPKSGKGYRVLSEEDYAKEKAEAGDPRLAALRDFPVKK